MPLCMEHVDKVASCFALMAQQRWHWLSFAVTPGWGRWQGAGPALGPPPRHSTTRLGLCRTYPPHVTDPVVVLKDAVNRWGELLSEGEREQLMEVGREWAGQGKGGMVCVCVVCVCLGEGVRGDWLVRLQGHLLKRIGDELGDRGLVGQGWWGVGWAGGWLDGVQCGHRKQG